MADLRLSELKGSILAPSATLSGLELPAQEVPMMLCAWIVSLHVWTSQGEKT